MGKQERAMRREGAAEHRAHLQARAASLGGEPDPAGEPYPALAPGPTVRMVGLRAIEGQGWCWYTLDVPLSLLEHEASTRGGPDILPIALGKSVAELEVTASKGVQR